jgi:hypothetical protein
VLDETCPHNRGYIHAWFRYQLGALMRTCSCLEETYCGRALPLYYSCSTKFSTLCVQLCTLKFGRAIFIYGYPVCSLDRPVSTLGI